MARGRRALTERRQAPEPVEQLLQAGVVEAGPPWVGQGGADARQQEPALAGHGEAAARPLDEPRLGERHGHRGPAPSPAAAAKRLSRRWGRGQKAGGVA